MSAAQYDAFEHLQQALGLEPGSLVMMLDAYTAYLDVSRGAEPVYVVGGYVASVNQWNRFKPKWKQMLADYDTDMFVPADLDLKDENGQRIGTYKGWSDDKMLAFQRSAHEVIKRYRRVAVSFTIPIDEFRRVKFGWMREEDGPARLYFYAAIEALKNISRWIERYKIKEPIQYVFEDGDEGYDEVQRALREIQKDPKLKARHNMQGFARQEKNKIIQFQAAGLWAYECYKQAANQYVGDGKIPIRDSMRSLYRTYDAPYNTIFRESDVNPLFDLYKGLGGKWEVQDAEWYSKRSGEVKTR